MNFRAIAAAVASYGIGSAIEIMRGPLSELLIWNSQLAQQNKESGQSSDPMDPTSRYGSRARPQVTRSNNGKVVRKSYFEKLG